jgi:hypothetical protein
MGTLVLKMDTIQQYPGKSSTQSSEPAVGAGFAFANLITARYVAR